MLAEDQNKIISKKLQSFEQLPEGFEFSSDAVWQQLETKLLQQKKASSIPLISNYLVAASILLAISLTTFLLNRKQDQPTKDRIVSKKFLLSNKVAPELIVDAKIQATKKEVRNNSSNKKIKMDAPIANTIALEPILISTEPNQQQQPIVETVTTNTTIATVIEKKQPLAAKRLPIVHINELNRAPEPVYSKSNNKNIQINDVEESSTPYEHPKPWWQPKPKPINTIISLTDNQ